jgi:hypothetical protein
MACLQRLIRQAERQETVKRIIRVFAVLSATAMVSALTLSGASASTVKPAVTSHPNTTKQSDCLFGEGYVDCYLENRDLLWAAGDTHGGYVYADDQNGTRYYFTPYETSGGETYGYISNTSFTLCWNLNPAVSNLVGLDSCPIPDNNEMFAMVPCADGSWCINSLDYGGNYKLFADENGLALAVAPGVNDASEWDALSSTP